MSENVPDKPYSVRFVQLSPRRSYQAMVKGKTTRVLSPRDLMQIVAKFKINEDEFFEQLVTLKKGLR